MKHPAERRHHSGDHAAGDRRATPELLVELGLARRIDVGTSATLYDARTESHQHTVCRRCGRVEDLDGDLPTEGLMLAAARTGFQARSVELVISGLCADCLRAR